MTTETDLDVAVVGAGVAGLHTARRLRATGRQVRVFEALPRVGGRMRTLRRSGFVIDEGAEAIASHGFPTTWQLIEALGLTAREVPRIPGSLAVWRDGRAHPGLGRLEGLRHGLGLSPRARRQLLRFTLDGVRLRSRCDPDHPEATALGRRTVAEFAARYGPELAGQLIEPLVTAFTGWYPERSAAGPFVAHMLAARSTAGWRTYRDGMDTLARRLAADLDVATSTAVREVGRRGGGARLELADGTRLSARAVVLAVPAPVALRLYPGIPADERPYVAASTFSVRLRVSFALRRPLTLVGCPSAYALVIPRTPEPGLSALTIDHLKHPDRVPPGTGLVGALADPDAARELIDAPDEEVVERLTEAAEPYLPGLRAMIADTGVHRFRHGVPEATPEALGLRSAFLRRPVRAVEYAGDWVMQRPSSEGALRSAALALPRLRAHGRGRGRAEQPARLPGGRR